jgi:ABC-type sugar transport system permease subunit
VAANVFVEPILLSPGQQTGIGSTVPSENTFVNLYALQRIYGDGDFGYGAAIAWIFVLLLVIVTALVFSSGRFWVFSRGQYGK